MSELNQYLSFGSRRSPVLANNGMVASSQPLATYAGLQILEKGGTAADAAVACAAALNVTEPMSTGIGGDCFCLYYDASKKRVYGVNGSGRAPKNLSIELLREKKIRGKSIPSKNPNAVTVPGAVAGWVDTVEKHGILNMGEVLTPAIKLAKEGFPVSPLTSFAWQYGQTKLWNSKNSQELLLGNQGAPQPGQIFRNPNLAKIFRGISEEGKSAFYEGRIADSIINVLGEKGGVMNHEDLRAHRSTFDDPITTNYNGVDIYEIPPNGQGITALIALNILEGYDLTQLGPLSAEYYHLLVESMRLAFADSRHFVSDPQFSSIPMEGLLSKKYATKRRDLISQNQATVDQIHGSPMFSSDTVYLCAVDKEGNACSFINSNYESFGTGIIPEGTGFVLQNRGSNFSLDPAHLNALVPGKRPYHTIIPGMALQNGDLYCPFGVMGGFMQPQGHVQVLSRMIDFGLEPQAALDAPRFCLGGGLASGVLNLEMGIPKETVSALKKMGHRISYIEGFQRSMFGRGQIIRRTQESGVLWAGSDPRSDGCAMGY